MNIEWLKDFQTLADTGNFTFAARKQNVSQAAFSRRIQALESWVGTSLVNRETYPVQMTYAGQRFLAETNDILSNLNDTRAALSSPALGTTSHVHISIPHVLSNSRFSRWWQNWSEGTRMSVTLSVGNVSEMIAKFITGTTDILICYNGTDLPILLDPDYYLSCEIEKDRLSPYAASRFTQQYENRFPGTENAPIPLLRYSKGAYFARLVDLIIKQSPSRLNSITQIETDMSSVIQNCVSSGFGIGWLPESCVEPHYKKMIKKISTEGWSMDLEINAYMHRSTIGKPANLIWEKISGQLG